VPELLKKINKIIEPSRIELIQIVVVFPNALLIDIITVDKY